MSDWFLLLGAAGLTIIVSQGKVFASVRRLWPRFLSCSMCVGFWIGLGAGAARALEMSSFTDRTVAIVVTFAYGGATSATAYLLNLVYDRLEVPHS